MPTKHQNHQIPEPKKAGSSFRIATETRVSQLGMVGGDMAVLAMTFLAKGRGRGSRRRGVGFVLSDALPTSTGVLTVLVSSGHSLRLRDHDQNVEKTLVGAVELFQKEKLARGAEIQIDGGES